MLRSEGFGRVEAIGLTHSHNLLQLTDSKVKGRSVMTNSGLRQDGVR